MLKFKKNITQHEAEEFEELRRLRIERSKKTEPQNAKK